MKPQPKTEGYSAPAQTVHTCMVCLSAPAGFTENPNSLHCKKCAAMNPSMKEMRERREAGLCLHCGERTPDKQSPHGLCTQCKQRKNEFSKKFKQQADAEAAAENGETSSLDDGTSGGRRKARIKAAAQAMVGDQTPGSLGSSDFELKDGERSLATRRGDDGATNHLIGVPLSDVKSRAMKFLWAGRIPLGKGMVAAGPPGKGKSTAVMSIAARVTTGEDFPDGAKNELGKRTVLWAGTEDDLEDTVKPRLQAMGADLTKFIALKRVVSNGGSLSSRRLLLKNDVKLLYKMLKENPDVALVIFDPITGYYGGADGNSSKEIRPIMESLAEVCRNTGVTIVAIMHENRRKDVTALERVLGSSAVGQVFRAAFRFSDDPKNKGGFIMACSKTNYKTKGGLRYTIQDAEVTLDDGTVAKEIGKVVWGEVHELSADDVIQQQAEEREAGAADDSVIGKAAKIFQEALADGKPHLCKEVHGLLDKCEIKLDKNARDKARYKLGVKTLGKAPGPWWWQLPKPGVEAEFSTSEAERKIPDQEEL